MDRPKTKSGKRNSKARLSQLDTLGGDSGLVDFVDLLASEFGWTDDYIFSKTLYQLNKYAKRIVNRQASEYRVLADIFRVAQHGNAQQYQKFIKGFDKSKGQQRSTKLTKGAGRGIESGSQLPGIAVKKSE